MAHLQLRGVLHSGSGSSPAETSRAAVPKLKFPFKTNAVSAGSSSPSSQQQCQHQMQQQQQQQQQPQGGGVGGQASAAGAAPMLSRGGGFGNGNGSMKSLGSLEAASTCTPASHFSFLQAGSGSPSKVASSSALLHCNSQGSFASTSMAGAGGAGKFSSIARNAGHRKAEAATSRPLRKAHSSGSVASAPKSSRVPPPPPPPQQPPPPPQLAGSDQNQGLQSPRSLGRQTLSPSSSRLVTTLTPRLEATTSTPLWTGFGRGCDSSDWDDHEADWAVMDFFRTSPGASEGDHSWSRSQRELSSAPHGPGEPPRRPRLPHNHQKNKNLLLREQAAKDANMEVEQLGGSFKLLWKEELKYGPNSRPSCLRAVDRSDRDSEESQSTSGCSQSQSQSQSQSNPSSPRAAFTTLMPQGVSPHLPGHQEWKEQLAKRKADYLETRLRLESPQLSARSRKIGPSRGKGEVFQVLHSDSIDRRQRRTEQLLEHEEHVHQSMVGPTLVRPTPARPGNVFNELYSKRLDYIERHEERLTMHKQKEDEENAAVSYMNQASNDMLKTQLPFVERLDGDGTKRSERRQVAKDQVELAKQQVCPFKPEILESARSLVRGIADWEDQEAVRLSKLQHLREVHANQKDAECTFHPSTLTSSSHIVRANYGDLDAHERLHLDSMRRQGHEVLFEAGEGEPDEHEHAFELTEQEAEELEQVLKRGRLTFDSATSIITFLNEAWRFKPSPPPTSIAATATATASASASATATSTATLRPSMLGTGASPGADVDTQQGGALPAEDPFDAPEAEDPGSFWAAVQDLAELQSILGVQLHFQMQYAHPRKVLLPERHQARNKEILRRRVEVIIERLGDVGIAASELSYSFKGGREEDFRIYAIVPEREPETPKKKSVRKSVMSMLLSPRLSFDAALDSDSDGDANEDPSTFLERRSRVKAQKEKARKAPRDARMSACIEKVFSSSGALQTQRTSTSTSTLRRAHSSHQVKAADIVKKIVANETSLHGHTYGFGRAMTETDVLEMISQQGVLHPRVEEKETVSRRLRWN